jgi:hypothetical protein
MHAFRLNQTGKLSVREVYHDHENHDYTETKVPGIRMGYRYEPESVETKMSGGPYMGEPAANRGWKKLRFWKKLWHFSKVAPKIEPTGATKQSLEASTLCASSDCFVLMVTQFFHATFEKCHKP